MQNSNYSLKEIGQLYIEDLGLRTTKATSLADAQCSLRQWLRVVPELSTQMIDRKTMRKFIKERRAEGVAPTTIKRDKTPIDAAFAEVGWVPDGDVFFDYDTATAADPLLGTCTCTDACFTAAAYGNLDGDASLSVLLFTHPDAAGGFCETGQGGNQSPPLNGGARMFDQVARVLSADEF